jgi:oligosaccharide repeat unit polymerase
MMIKINFKFSLSLSLAYLIFNCLLLSLSQYQNYGYVLLFSFFQFQLIFFILKRGAALNNILYLSSTVIQLYGIFGFYGANSEQGLYYSLFISKESFFIYILSHFFWFSGVLLTIKYNTANIINNKILSNNNFENYFFLLLTLYFICTLIFFDNWKNFSVFNLFTYEDVALSERVISRDNPYLSIKNVFILTPLYSVFIFLLIKKIFYYKSYKKFFFIFVLLNILIPIFYTGSKSAILLFFLFLFYYFNVRVKRISSLNIFFGIIFSTFFMQFISLIRSRLTEIFDGIFFLKDFWRETFDLSQSGEFAVSQNLLILIEGIKNGTTDFLGFNGLVNNLLSYVPRLIYTGRPEDMALLFVKIFQPEIFKEGGGMGFYIIQEFYWYFGLTGVYFCATFWGFFTNTVSNFFLKKSSSDIFFMCWIILLYNIVFISTRTGVLLMPKAIFSMYLPIFITYAIAYFLLAKSKLHSEKK